MTGVSHRLDTVFVLFTDHYSNGSFSHSYDKQYDNKLLSQVHHIASLMFGTLLIQRFPIEWSLSMDVYFWGRGTVIFPEPVIVMVLFSIRTINNIIISCCHKLLVSSRKAVADEHRHYLGDEHRHYLVIR